MHRDRFHRVTVVLAGDLLNIEFRDIGETQSWKITVGEVDWSESSDRVHRAVNVGKEVFEEVVIFLDNGQVGDWEELPTNRPESSRATGLVLTGIAGSD
jgi:hypothetical protein